MNELLSRLHGPGQLRDLGPGEVQQLADEIRNVLVRTIACAGGDLGPNLGMVELTIALHGVFASPAEPILFGVGHQAYADICVEDGVVVGGAGSRVQQHLTEHDVAGRVHCLGLPRAFLPHGSIGQVRRDAGVTAPDIARRVVDRYLRGVARVRPVAG